TTPVQRQGEDGPRSQERPAEGVMFPGRAWRHRRRTTVGLACRLGQAKRGRVGSTIMVEDVTWPEELFRIRQHPQRLLTGLRRRRCRGQPQAQVTPEKSQVQQVAFYSRCLGAELFQDALPSCPQRSATSFQCPGLRRERQFSAIQKTEPFGELPQFPHPLR